MTTEYGRDYKIADTAIDNYQKRQDHNKDFPYIYLIEQELRNYEDRYLKLGLTLTARSVIKRAGRKARASSGLQRYNTAKVIFVLRRLNQVCGRAKYTKRRKPLGMLHSREGRGMFPAILGGRRSPMAEVQAYGLAAEPNQNRVMPQEKLPEA